MKNPVLLLLVSIICSAFPVMAQNVSVQLGATFEPSSVPRFLGEAALGLGYGENLSLTTIQIRPISARQISTAVVTGMERTLYKLQKAEFAICGQAGIAATGENASGIALGCLTLLVPVRQDLSVGVRGEARNAPVEGGLWDSRMSVFLRWHLGETQ